MTPHEILDNIRGKQILVVGDPIRDDYVFGRVERICPEAPVPVFIPERRETRQGGAANVARQLTVLGCHVTTHFPQNVSVKTRYMVGSHLVLRVDEDSKYGHAYQDDVDALAKYYGEGDFHAVVISDYAKGWVTYKMAQAAIDLGIPTIVDPKGTDWSKYKGANFICPNEKEYSDEGAQDFSCVLLKRGDKGMFIFGGAGSDAWTAIPATARRVYDVTGAGDTVVATFAAALSAGANRFEAARLASIAAGEVVGQVGTAVVTADRLRELLDEQ